MGLVSVLLLLLFLVLKDSKLKLKLKPGQICLLVGCWINYSLIRGPMRNVSLIPILNCRRMFVSCNDIAPRCNYLLIALPVLHLPSPIPINKNNYIFELMF